MKKKKKIKKAKISEGVGRRLSDRCWGPQPFHSPFVSSHKHPIPNHPPPLPGRGGCRHGREMEWRRGKHSKHGWRLSYWPSLQPLWDTCGGFKGASYEGGRGNKRKNNSLLNRQNSSVLQCICYLWQCISANVRIIKHKTHSIFAFPASLIRSEELPTNKMILRSLTNLLSMKLLRFRKFMALKAQILLAEAPRTTSY